MTNPTAPSAATPSDDDLSLSVHLKDPADPLSVPEIPAADSPAQAAARRLGGRGGRRLLPVGGGRPPVRHVVAGLVALLLAGMVITLWLTVRQQQIQLTTLDAAFRSGQLQALSDRMLDAENQLQHLVTRSQAEQWQQDSERQGAELASLKAQLSALAEEVNAARTTTAQVVSGLGVRTDTLEKTLAEQTQRISVLTGWKEAQDRRSAAPAVKPVPASGSGSPAAKKPPAPANLKPPFSLVSTERRGGQAYAVILPQGTAGWSQLRMLSPGEGYSGWVLVSVSDNQAGFRVNGRVQQVTL